MKKNLSLLLLAVSFITACKKNNNSKPSTPVITTIVSTLAGSGLPGSTNGVGTTASFDNPVGVAVDASSNIYVAEQGNSLIRKISPTGVVSTFAGSGVHNTADGIGTAASFYELQAIAVDASGNVYVADGSIRKVTPIGIVSTLQGGNSINGRGIAVDVAGNLYVADPVRHVVRKISSSGIVSTLGTATSFNEPIGIAVDASGNVFVTDIGNKSVYKINANGVVSTLASNVDKNILYVPTGIAVDKFDNVYVTDFFANVILKITAAGTFSTFAGSGSKGSTNGIGTGASFYAPNGAAVDVSGNVYVADSFNNLIRKIVVQ
jgi:sugar lactone lactonase YvrE